MPSDTTAVRDELARMMGFVKAEDDEGYEWYDKDGKLFDDDHPIEDTLDSAAACMPEGWGWNKVHGWFAAYKIGRPSGGKNNVCVPDTGDEKLDRFNLALAARRAMNTNATDPMNNAKGQR